MIPKLIVQYWDQSDLPADISDLLKTWEENNPGFTYALFNRDRAVSYIQENFGSEVVSAFLSAAVPAMRSDIFRVAFIFKEGGVYIDAATESKAGLDFINGLDFDVVLMRKWHGAVWNGFIAAPPGSRYLKDVLDNVVKNVRRRISNNVWEVTGPGVFNRVLSLGDYNVKVFPQADLAGSFLLVNDLKHKKKSHWSKVQESLSIYVEAPIDRGDSRRAIDCEFKRVIFHLGPHKTGTTTFQSLLEDNELELAGKGVRILTAHSENSVAYRNWRIGYTMLLQSYLLGKLNERDAVHRLSKKLRELVAICRDGDALLVSDENLLGPMPGHFFARGMGRDRFFYSAAGVVFSAISSAFSDVSLDVLVVKRDLHSFLTSAYRDFVLKLHTSQNLVDFFSEFHDDFFKSYLKFYSGHYAQLPVNFSVSDFEDFVRSMSCVLSDLLGVDVGVCSGRVRNQSLSWKAIEMALALIPHIESEVHRAKVGKFLLAEIDGESKDLAAQVVDVRESVEKMKQVTV